MSCPRAGGGVFFEETSLVGRGDRRLEFETLKKQAEQMLQQEAQRQGRPVHELRLQPAGCEVVETAVQAAEYHQQELRQQQEWFERVFGEEERRLAYVALSRAREELCISYITDADATGGAISYVESPSDGVVEPAGLERAGLGPPVASAQPHRPTTERSSSPVPAAAGGPRGSR